MKTLSLIKKIILSSMLILTLGGCQKNIPYDNTLGFLRSNLKCEKVEVNIYHSNTPDHKWEKLKTLTTGLDDIEPDHYLNINFQGKDDHYYISLNTEYAEKSKDAETIISTTLDSFEFVVDGANYFGYHKNDIKNSSEEQIFMICYISKTSKHTYFEKVSLTEPYDLENANADNLLITIKLN